MMKFENSKIYKNIINKKPVLFFVSPHLDDAIYSMGNIIKLFSQQNIKVILVNVFTKPSAAKHSLSVRKFMHSCEENDPNKLYQERIAEDKIAANIAGFGKIHNLGYVDALWRQKTGENPFKNILPELGYVYPLFRFTALKGKISKHDKGIFSKLGKDLKNIVYKNKNYLVFCPIGTGSHIDHIIVRDVCRQIFPNLIYWDDYPYFLESDTDEKYIDKYKLIKLLYETDNEDKLTLLEIYKSQYKLVFGIKQKLTQINKEYLYTLID